LKQKLQIRLEELGFEFLSSKQSQLVEKIKVICISTLASLKGDMTEKLSQVLSNKLHREYNYLSNLFSSVEGITIEQYFIRQRVEKIKELLVYDELSLTEIAYKLNFSSVSHLSGQFKKITGFTPSKFRTLKYNNRTPIDKL
jgi:AraC-like DNA-binding protein